MLKLVTSTSRGTCVFSSKPTLPSEIVQSAQFASFVYTFEIHYQFNWLLFVEFHATNEIYLQLEASSHTAETPQTPNTHLHINTSHQTSHVRYACLRDPSRSLCLCSARGFLPVNSSHRWQGVNSPYVRAVNLGAASSTMKLNACHFYTQKERELELT
jgi:hypothetical protein